MKYEEMTLEQLQEIIKQQEKEIKKQEQTIENLKREKANQKLLQQQLKNN